MESKKRCYPNGLSMAETEATVNLQCLLNHTAKRQLENFKCFPNKSTVNYIFGLEGITGHIEFRQIHKNPSALGTSVILTSVVPVHIAT